MFYILPKHIVVVLLIAVVMSCAGDIYAQSSVACHCFRDRTYNPQQKFASDEYILATSFNSLMARGLGVAKRQIVMIKMKEGVGQEDLLISLAIAQASKSNSNQLLDLNKTMSWQKIIADWQFPESSEKGKILVKVRSGLASKEAAVQIANQLLVDYFAITLDDVKKVRALGLNEKEMSLVFILAHFSQLKPAALIVQYKEQGKSWSEIAQSLGVDPVAAGKLIMNYPNKQIKE